MSSTTDNLDDAKSDSANLIDEAKNRVQAVGERLKRTVAGGSMSPGEQIISHVKEAGNELKAGLDKTVRELRHRDETDTDISR
jgi:hypothetical protein